MYGMSILVCIPAFNEEPTIKNVVEDALRYADSVAVCDDGSLDETKNKAEKAGAYVIKHEKNLGKGAALRSLFKYASYSNADVIVTMDGDGQSLPKEIPKLTKPINENKSDIVIGYRFDTNQMPQYRKIGNKFLDMKAKI